MTNLSHIISTYEERFDEEFKDYRDNTTLQFNLNKIKAFNRNFALELVKESFAATKVEKLKDIKLPEPLYSDAKSRGEAWNSCVDEVEARQQQFINEQQ